MAVGERIPHHHSMVDLGLYVMVATLLALGVGAYFTVRSGNLALQGETAQGRVVALSEPTHTLARS